MPDPITLGSVGALVLSEGIKFLYGQATDLLKRWRDHSQSADKPISEPVQVALPPGAFVGQLAEPRIYYQELEQVHIPMNEARKFLLDYTDGTAEVDPSDTALIAKVDLLRQLLESVYQQRITFAHEDRAPSGPLAEGRISADRVLGAAIGTDVDQFRRGTARGEANVKEVGPGGTAAGTRIKNLG